jgi:hypothetical protein
MKITQNVLIGLAITLFSVPALSAQDLSKYRDFSLGSSLAVVSKQAKVVQGDVSTTHESPIPIQSVTYWPSASGDAAGDTEAVQQVELSFCNGALYSVSAVYRTSATEGLTGEDLIRAISADYGVPTRPVPDVNPPASHSFKTVDTQIAVWQDSQYSATLYHSPLSGSFHLVVVSKQLQAQADEAIAQDVVQERDDAPRRESALAKKVADDQESLRQTNLKAFHP